MCKGADWQKGALGTSALCSLAPRDAQGTGVPGRGLQHRLPPTGLGAGGVSAGKRFPPAPAVPEGCPGVPPLYQGPQERGGLKNLETTSVTLAARLQS